MPASASESDSTTSAKDVSPARAKTLEWLEREILDDEVLDSIVLYDGYDEAIVGLAERHGMPLVVCYDREKILKQLMEDGMSHEDAVEFFDYNIIGAWVGDHTPIFVTPRPSEQSAEG